MGNRESAEHEAAKTRSVPARQASLRPGSLHDKLLQQEEATNDSAFVVTDDDDNTIARLQETVERLAKRCACLEAQNVLVSVQQLDLLAQATAWFLSLTSLLLYWRVVFWLFAHAHVLTGSLEKLGALLGVSPMRQWSIPSSLFSWLPKIHYSLELWNTVQTSLKSSLIPFIKVDGLTAALWIVSRLVQAVLLMAPYLHNRRTHGSTHRRFQVFCIAAIVIIRIRLARWREHMFAVDNESTAHDYGQSMTEDAIWDANYEVSARFLYVSIRRLRGLWVKTAQYLASRADFMPVAYVRELKKLQDEAPATPWHEIAPTIPPDWALTDIDPIELASASIGQVHSARLDNTFQDTAKSTKVVLKVQHPHARTLMLDDFWSLAVLLRIVAWLEPEYEFLAILVREWATEARKELDFSTEANNLQTARAAIQTLFPREDSVVYAKDEEGNLVPFQVEIPAPVPSLSNRDALVMSFCEGTRIDDLDQLDEWGLSRQAIMDGVAQVFAHMMYCTDIFNCDPHLGNLLVRPGTHNSKAGFTVVLLDWGLAKRLSSNKRLAFCQLVYAAATLDYGLLLDSYKLMGLKMKREDSSRSMENVRFFLRDMAPRETARRRIRAKIQSDKVRNQNSKDKVPMESKAYPGELFFFIRVNELLHGLGSQISVDLNYLDVIRPYAERGLRLSQHYNEVVEPLPPVPVADQVLQAKLQKVLLELKEEQQLVGAQACVLDKEGNVLADVVEGNLGGLKSHIPMQRTALILGYSCTKAIAATMAHIMVEEGYLTYDEPVCERVWKDFCPFDKPPRHLDEALDVSSDDLLNKWHWKRQITLRHILTHKAGFWSALPTRLTIKSMASCEECAAAFEYNHDSPQDTLLPTRKPGEVCEYHFMSFGWLVAGALCGAYSLKHGTSGVTFDQVYQAILLPKLSPKTVQLGFRPMGGNGGFVLAQTATSDIRASKLLQMRRERQAMGEKSPDDQSQSGRPSAEVLKSFVGKEFLLDPRVWNSIDAIDACVPAAGGRFSAAGLAHFYFDLANGRLLQSKTFADISTRVQNPMTGELQGLTRMTNDSDRTSMGFGYQMIQFDGDQEGSPSGIGHAGVGGSIGFVHQPTGMAAALMLNKADGGKEITMRIMRVFADHFDL